ncbi:PASTA domain-containing protein [Petrocella sp. FN5]|uniref:PASTA domain-containing protein n=1 Tax=Petrocella sp. FN5 TaxID=3032002 RepID=UPI0023D98931|nr:PASTA domain-containing protein [Petrocella sp. FN5]MDF1617323.1 PASTA domain-containing protein [Petrocella sp. FN5]
MAKFAIKGIGAAKKGIIILSKEILKDEVFVTVVKEGTKALEKYNNKVKIPDVKDVLYEEAIKNLIGLNLLPVVAIAKPNVAYADSAENVVVDCEPKFGKKVDPNSIVKLYYATSDVIQKSKEMETNLEEVFRLPRVVGLDIYEAREDLEEIGLRATLKLENPNSKFVTFKDGQVTRVTYPGDKKLTLKQKKGERVWLYYVDEEIIKASELILENKKTINIERNEKLKQSINNLPKRFRKNKNLNQTEDFSKVDQE